MAIYTDETEVLPMSMIEKMLKIHPKEVTTDRFVIDLNMPADYPAIEAPVTEEGGVREIL